MTIAVAEPQSLPRELPNFNGVDGEHGKSAYLWLAAMKRCRAEGTSPSIYLKHIDTHLEGDAEWWVKNTESVRILIYKGYMDLATESDIEAFHGALSERFKLTVEETIAMRDLMPQVHLIFLKQGASENLEQYYSRARDLLLSLHGRDSDNDTLTPVEISLRSIAIARFLNGLRKARDSSGTSLILRLQQQQILHHTVSLHQAFKMVEVESKRMDLEKEREDSKEREQEKKRKLAKDEKETDNAKKQKHTIVKLKLALGSKSIKPKVTPQKPEIIVKVGEAANSLGLFNPVDSSKKDSA